VVASRKDERLRGVPLLLVQPLDLGGNPSGRLLVATDALTSKAGDLVVLVRAREASLAFDTPIPSDCSIVARVDSLDP
jgi:microcompartment protein CcmK/EutM